MGNVMLSAINAAHSLNTTPLAQLKPAGATSREGCHQCINASKRRLARWLCNGYEQVT